MSGAGDEATRKRDAEDCKNKGNEFLAKKEYQSAIDWYKQAITLDPTNHVYYSNRSAAYLSMGYKDAALKDAKECIKINPNWSKGYSRVGAAYHALEKYDEAIKAFDEGLKIEPGNSALLQGKKDVEKAMKGPEPGEEPPGMDNLMQQLLRNPAVMGYFQKHPEKMAQLSSNPMSALQDPEFMSILQSALGSGGGMGGMGGMPPGGMPPMPPHGMSNEYEPPERDESPSPPPKPKTKSTDKKEDINLPPEKKNALKKKEEGNDLYKKKDFNGAIKLYEEAQKIDEKDIIYSVNIAACKVELGLYDEAIKICEDAITKGREINAPFDSIGKAYSRIGNIYFKQKKYELAIEYYEKSLLESQNQQTKGQLLEAKRLLEIKKKEEYEDPEIAKQHKEKGNELMSQNKVPEAIKEYDEAIKRNPKDAILYCNRGAAYSKLMDYGRALTDIEKSLKLNPNYVKGWGRKGLIEYSLKKYHRAIEAYQKGLAIDPNNTICKEGLEATQLRIQEGMYKVDPERQERAQQDPEIQRLLVDPMVQQALKDLSDPKCRDKVMENPGIQEKINTLIAAGMICMGTGPTQQ